MITYPLNNIDYAAEDAELFHCTRKSGVYDGDAFPLTVTGLDNNIVIGPGIAWIQNTQFSGKVVANKADFTISPELSDSVNPRIDAVVIQFDVNENATNIVMKTGVAASIPVAPAVIRTESVYELHLCHVYRAAGAAVVAEEDITDLRTNADYCGIMFDPISSIDATLTIPGYAADAAAVGAALVGIAKVAVFKTTLFAAGWSAEAPYTQTVSVDGILAAHEPFVDVYLENVEDVSAVLEAWTCVGRVVTADGTVTAYCYDDVPSADMPIILKVVG